MVMLGDLLARAAATAPDGTARLAVARFERHAAPEDWATLMSRLAHAADPGADCLEFMMRWSERGGLGPRSTNEEHSMCTSTSTPPMRPRTMRP